MYPLSFRELAIFALACLCITNTIIIAQTPYDTVHAFDASSSTFFVRQNMTTIGAVGSTTNITSGLVGYWTFDENGGSLAADISGYNNNGTLTNSPTWTKAQVSNGLVFNGLENLLSSYVMVPDSPTMDGFDSYSVCAWGYLLSYNVGFRTILSKSTTAFNLPYADPYELYFFGVKGSSWSGLGMANKLSLRHSTGVAGTVFDTTTSGTISLNAWHHMCGTYDHDKIRLYVDGALASTSATNVITIGSNSLPLNIGNYGASNEFDTWDGTLDDVRVYNRAISLLDVINIYNAGRTNSFSSSTTYRMVGAGGGTAVGSSTSSSFNLNGGYVVNLYKGPSPTYEQSHYHWRNDDGSESAASSATSGIQDTALNALAKLTTKRLRIEIANEGGTKTSYTSQQFRLEYGLKVTTCAAISSWVDVGAVGGDWDMVASSNLTDAADTTNIALAIGGVGDANHTFLTPNGGVKESGSQAAAIKVSSEHFMELEYSINALAAATDTGVYCFRVTNAGATTNFRYAAYPEVTISSVSLSFSVDSSSQAFPLVTPGTVSATTSILSITTSNATGFIVTVQRGDSTGTMSLGSIYIPDKTAWSAPPATTTVGNSSASTTQPLTLQFRIRSAGTDTPNYASIWWGTADTTAAALFAGFPTSQQNIINRSTAAGSGTTARVLYNLNVPATQQNGSYAGSITYTATANP